MLSVNGSRELQAAVLALKGADRDLRRRIYARMRETMNPVWRQAVSARLTDHMQARVIGPGTRIAAGNPPRLVAAASKRSIGRGLVPDHAWPGYEYGANREQKSTYQRTSPRGTQHTVTRRTMRHLKPRRRGGYVLGPATAETIPRLLSLTVQSVVREYMDILNPRG